MYIYLLFAIFPRTYNGAHLRHGVTVVVVIQCHVDCVSHDICIHCNKTYMTHNVIIYFCPIKMIYICYTCISNRYQLAIWRRMGNLTKTYILLHFVMRDHISFKTILKGGLFTWWRHQMETFSALLDLCAGNSPVTVNSPHKGQWRGALMFSLIWMNGWVNNREAGDLRCHRVHYDIIVMKEGFIIMISDTFLSITQYVSRRRQRSHEISLVFEVFYSLWPSDAILPPSYKSTFF